MNDVVINKIQSVQRCVRRAREELAEAGPAFASDYTRQDAAILNVTRACEQALDLANHIVKTRRLGIPGDSGQTFDLLEKGGIISPELSGKLKKMIGFRNIVVHEYQDLNLDIVVKVITENTSDIIAFTDLFRE